MMLIRSAQPEDIPALCAFGELVIPETYAHLTSADYAIGMLRNWWSVAYFEGAFQSPNTLFLLGLDEADQSLIAFSEAEIQGEQCILWKLYVHPDRRGKGIGTLMLRALKERLPSGVRYLKTEYLSLNKLAGAFYLKNGFHFDHLEEDRRESRFSYTWLRLPLQASLEQTESLSQPSSESHRGYATSMGSVPCAIVTVSDTRTLQTDTNGKYLAEQIAAMGHYVTAYRIVRDEAEEIQSVLEDLCHNAARIIIFSGGTGISQRDTTYDVVQTRLTKTLPGFGELFRVLSYQQVGAAAMLSRATAGLYCDKVIICLPGSPAAVQLAWEKLIAPEIQHLAWEIAR